MIMYVHESRNWPNFVYNIEDFLDDLSRVRILQGKVTGGMEAIGFELQNQAVLSTMSLEIIKSSEIEGKEFNLEEVRSSVARRLGIKNQNQIESGRDVDGIVEMMVDVSSNAQKEISEERIFGWHSCLFPTGYNGMYKIKVAEYRDGPMQVVSGGLGNETVHYEAPSAERIQSEMKKFIEWINTSQIEPVVKAAVAHFWFVTIHPFEDGNGRIARAIADLLLARSDMCSKRFYSMSSQIQKERKDYYSILEATQRGDGDITLWIKWFVECLERALLNTENVLFKVFEKFRFWKKFEDSVFNERQKKILNMLLDGFDGNLTSGKYAKICKVSTDTALNDLNDLVKKNVLQKGEAGGRSTNYLLV